MTNFTKILPKRRITKFTAALVALSLGVSGLSAAPARADDADVARAIGGLLTLFVIGKAIENGSSKSKITTSVSNKPQRNQVSAFDIPNACVVSIRDKRSRLQTVVLEDCIKRERRSAAALPRACETSVKVKHNNTRSDAYDVGCLNNFGYRVAQNGTGHNGRALR
jgi:hypothetical protein